MRTQTLALLAGAGLMLAAGPCAAGLATTLALVERVGAGEVLVDVGDKGDSPGDILAFANEVYDKDNAKKVGTDNGWCIRIAAGKSWECSFTVILEDGQLAVHGPFFDGQDSVMMVTGTTGKYSGMTGEMVLHTRNKEATEYDFAFTLKE